MRDGDEAAALNLAVDPAEDHVEHGERAEREDHGAFDAERLDGEIAAAEQTAEKRRADAAVRVARRRGVVASVRAHRWT